MSVIGEVSAILQVAATAAAISTRIAGFIRDASEVNETTNDLLEHVRNLHRTAEVVQTVLKRWGDCPGDRPLGHEERRVLNVIEMTLKAADEKIQWLQTKVESLGGGTSNSTWIRKGWTQLKYQLHLPAIEARQKHIQMNVVVLDLMLQCAKYEETRATRNEAVATRESLTDILNKIAEVKAMIRRPLPTTSSSTSNDEDELALNGESSDINEISDQTASLAEECVVVAESVYDKISRAGSVTDSTHGAVNSDSNPAIAQDGGNARPQRPGDDPDPTIELDDVLTHHIDNNYADALSAIRDEDFDKAEGHILEAIAHAKERHHAYGLIFEEQSFTEMHAFILTKQRRFVDAAEKYESVRTAPDMEDGYEHRGRIYYSIALMHRDKYYFNYRGAEHEAFFEAWKKNCVIAFNHAIHCHGVRRGSVDTHEPWKMCPSLHQAAELMVEMYTRWGKLAEAATYKERYLGRVEDPRSSALGISVSSPQPQTLLPTPPTTEPTVSPPASIYSLKSDRRPRSVRSIKIAASGGIFATVANNDYLATKYILDSADNTFHIDQINDDGLTPLLLAVRNSYTSIACLLLETSPKSNIKAKGEKDARDWTVLHYALLGPAEDELLDLLLLYGADVDASTMEGTPLHLAVANNNVKAAQKLIKKGAALGATDGAQRTPMTRAALEKKPDMVKLLIEEGASPNIAQFESRPDIQKFLTSIENGMKKSLENSRKKSLSSAGQSPSLTSNSRVFSRMRKKARNA